MRYTYTLVITTKIQLVILTLCYIYLENESCFRVAQNINCDFIFLIILFFIILFFIIVSLCIFHITFILFDKSFRQIVRYIWITDNSSCGSRGP